MPVLARPVACFGAVARTQLFELCVLASLFLHVLVLALSPGWRPSTPSQSRTQVLTVRITPQIVAMQASPSARAARPRAVPEPARANDAVTPARETLALASPAVSRAPQAPAVSAPATRATAAVPVAEAVSAAETLAAVGRQAETRARSGSASEAGSIDQYRLALIGVARRYKRYPAQAMEKGWQGRVEIRLVIGPEGTLQSNTVKISSGHAILDNQALTMVERASSVMPVPSVLHGREFSVDIPVIFDLQSE